jgi:DNA-binding response OmpR family regulator
MLDTRILIVDDDDAARALLLTVLRRRGLQADTARNGQEALERMGACRYTVVLLDLMMPILSGWDVLDQLGTFAPEARPVVIVLTAGGEPRNFQPGLVSGTVRKPFDIELLVDTVSGCVMAVSGEQSQLDGRAPAETGCAPAESDVIGKPRRTPEKPN